MIKFKKGTYKILYSHTCNKKNVEVLELNGYVFEYNGYKFGISKEAYNSNKELIKSSDWCITELSTGLGLRLYAETKEDVEGLLEKFDFSIFNNPEFKPHIEEARQTIKKSQMGGLLGRIKR